METPEGIKSEPKRYKIDSFKKLCNVVNTENATRLAVDLGQWLILYAKGMEEVRKSHPKETKNKTNSQIAEAHFIWIDDGKYDLDHATFEDKNTGEVTEVKFNRNPNDAWCDTTGDDSSTQS